MLHRNNTADNVGRPIVRTLNCNSVLTQLSFYDLLSRPFEVSAAPLISASKRSDTLATGTVVPSTHICVLKELNPSKDSICTAEYEKSKQIIAKLPL